MTKNQKKQPKKGKKSLFYTDYKKLDKLLGGFREGETIVVTGQTAVGKTAFLLTLAKAFADQNIGVAYFSLEMTNEDLYNRLMASLLRVSITNIENATPKIIEDLKKQNQYLETLPLFIECTHQLDFTELSLKVREAVKERKVKVICIDYIQLIAPTNNQKEEPYEETLKYISQGLNQLAKELQIAFIVNAQLNGFPEKRTSRQSQIIDIRGSNSIEQDADKIIVLSREMKCVRYFQDEEDAELGTIGDHLPKKLNVYLVKNRYGDIKMCTLFFEEEYAKISEKSDTAIFDLKGVFEEDDYFDRN